jgi:hypothetical protein
MSWNWKVEERGMDFVVQVPLVNKLRMLMEFDEFKSKAPRLLLNWIVFQKRLNLLAGYVMFGQGLRECLMQILLELDVFRFQVDVTRIKKYPIVRQFAVKPWMYDIAFAVDKVMNEGTLDKCEPHGN